MAIQIQSTFDGLLLPVKVVPGASRTRLLGEWDGRLKIAIAAPPERGKANDALITFLAKRLGLRRRQLRIAQGATSAVKMVSIEGVKPEEVLSALAGHDE